jgi:hypothetical protein
LYRLPLHRLPRHLVLVARAHGQLPSDSTALGSEFSGSIFIVNSTPRSSFGNRLFLWAQYAMCTTHWNHSLPHTLQEWAAPLPRNSLLLLTRRTRLKKSLPHISVELPGAPSPPGRSLCANR